MITFRILTKPIQSTALWRGQAGVREMRGNGHAESPRHGRRGVVNWEHQRCGPAGAVIHNVVSPKRLSTRYPLLTSAFSKGSVKTSAYSWFPSTTNLGSRAAISARMAFGERMRYRACC